MDENVLEQLIGCWQSEGWDFIFGEQAELDNIYFHVSDIIDNLKEYWDDTAPNADRLWMG